MALPRPLSADTQPPLAAPASLAAGRALLAGLNREQRRAVTHLSGPALVLAGPGTGKTEVVTRRVAWLIATKQARPRQILALTFTDNAAQEMQARVDMLVPYGQADAAIHTFHAFGDRLLREHAFELGLPAEPRLLRKPDLVVLLRENLFELGLERYLPLADPTRFLGALVDLFGRAKDEVLSADDLARDAAAIRPEDASPEQREALADLAGARSELARAYDRYIRLLAARGAIDHADQVSLALRLVRERPAVRQSLSERFRFMLVDELQDTNRAQMELVLALAGANPNVMAVGDPEQGIYGFRGARAGNVDRFRDAFPEVRSIALRRNYRSRAPIVDAAARLHQAAARPTHALRVAQIAHRRGRGGGVGHLVFDTPEAEADGVAAEIERRIALGTPPRDVAVLVRSNTEIDEIARSIRVRGIAVHTGARRRLAEVPTVRALLAFLRVVADPSDSVELYALASAAPYRLEGPDLALLLAGARRRSRSLWDALQDAVQSSDPHLSGTALRRAGTLVAHVETALQMAADRPSGEVLYDYLRRSGHLAALARADVDAGEAVAVGRFCQLIRARAALLSHDRIPFLVTHLASGLGDDDEDVEERDDAVRVLTVHRAKGLEFGLVFVCGLVDGRFPVRARPATLELPPGLLGERSDEDAALSEERRLFYVALTRARDEVCLTSHRRGPRGRGQRRPSVFIAEALHRVVVQAPATQPVPAGTNLDRVLLDPAPQTGPAPVPRSLSLSYSQVDEYLSCPERYRLRYEIGIPTPPHHALSYGSAIHGAIAAFHAAQARGEVMTEEQLTGELERNWQPDGFLSREHEEARYAAAREALRVFRKQQIASGMRPAAVERPFTFRLGPDEIRGRIDRIDATPQGPVITDYKSSGVHDQKRADTRARESLQLQMYAMAHEAETGTLPAAVQLHFIETGVIGRAVPDASRIDKARVRVAAAADGIRNRSFTPKPSPIACGFCPFQTVCASSAA